MNASNRLHRVRFLLIALMAAGPLGAQVNTASLTGIVSDPTGARVGGVKLGLTNEETGATRSQPMPRASRVRAGRASCSNWGA